MAVAVLVVMAGLALATSFHNTHVEARKVAPVVLTRQGVVRGVREYSEKGVPFFAFYGIPYAEPPLGKLRFQDPVEARPWVGVRDGSWQPDSCIQLAFSVTKANDTLDKEDVLGSEDCLYLNVFTPRVCRGRLPVLVFLHGGAYVSGSSKKFPPYVFLNHPVVFVVPQFRIGTFGFLSTEDAAAPGNVGLKDQTQALKWVQNNIRRFGGDPTRVTLFSHGTGAVSTHFHMLSPKSAGLFSRAILHSGSALSPFAMGARHREVALETALALACPNTSDSARIIECLQKAPVHELAVIPAKYYRWLRHPTFLAPLVDGDFLPAAPHLMLRDARHNSVDLMTGITTHDGAFISHVLYTNEELRAELVNNFEEIGPLILLLHNTNPPTTTNSTTTDCATTTNSTTTNSAINASTNLAIATAIFNYYLDGVNVDETNSEKVTQLFTDYNLGVPNDLIAQLHTRNTNRKVYAFEFTYRGQHSVADLMNPTVGKHWVTDGDEFLYLFSGGPFYSLFNLTRPDDLQVRAIMTQLWVNYAATGNMHEDTEMKCVEQITKEEVLRSLYSQLEYHPKRNPTPNGSFGFEWEAVGEGTGLPHLDIQLQPVMRNDTRRQVRDFLRSLLSTHQLLCIED